MKLSEDRISYLAHKILDGLWKQDLVDYRDETLALRVLKESLAGLGAVDDQIESLVREKLAKQKKIPGSREYQILYDKYFQEETFKRRR